MLIIHLAWLFSLAATSDHRLLNGTTLAEKIPLWRWECALVTRNGEMLDDLGRTSDEVASTLRSRGIVGVRNTVRILNPIVRDVYSLIPNAYSIDLIQYNQLRIEFASRDHSEVKVPAAVLEFLARFNEGYYPDLEMPTRS